jgi:hypothetical protein
MQDDKSEINVSQYENGYASPHIRHQFGYFCEKADRSSSLHNFDGWTLYF